MSCHPQQVTQCFSLSVRQCSTHSHFSVNTGLRITLRSMEMCVPDSWLPPVLQAGPPEVVLTRGSLGQTQSHLGLSIREALALSVSSVFAGGGGWSGRLWDQR